MIKNGLYSLIAVAIDGVDVEVGGVLILRDGQIHGGDSFVFYTGTYDSSEGKWKGEMTSQEHTPIVGTHPWARKVISIGFSGTYSDDGGELEAIALVGKRSFRFKSIYRLLVAD